MFVYRSVSNTPLFQLEKDHDLPPGRRCSKSHLRLPLHLIAPLHGCLIRSPHMCLRWLVGMATQANGSRMDRTIVSSLACPIVLATWKMSESFHLSIWVFPKIVVPPKSSILIGFSIINHPFWGTTILGNTHIIHSPQNCLHRIHLSHVSWDCRLEFSNADTPGWGRKYGQAANSMAENTGWLNNCVV